MRTRKGRYLRLLRLVPKLFGLGVVGLSFVVLTRLVIGLTTGDVCHREPRFETNRFRVVCNGPLVSALIQIGGASVVIGLAEFRSSLIASV